jgi:hypothetical protein
MRETRRRGEKKKEEEKKEKWKRERQEQKAVSPGLSLSLCVSLWFFSLSCLLDNRVQHSRTEEDAPYALTNRDVSRR